LTALLAIGHDSFSFESNIGASMRLSRHRPQQSLLPQLYGAVCLLLLVGLSTALPAAERAKWPNIVVILADDMGYGDVHALNPASKIPTPNLDRLAGAGMTFTDAHTPSAVCTPTRYGLLTGRYCWRTRLKSGVLNGYGEPLIDPDQQTVAAFLNKAGYTTGVVGKWHLGLGFAKDGKQFDFTKPVDDGPHTHGFDESLVIPASLDFPPYVYIRDGKLTAPTTKKQPAQKFPKFLRAGEIGDDFIMEDCLDKLTDEANAFVDRHAADEQPFFLYFPLTAPHKPLWPHQRFQGKTELGPYGDFIHQVDDSVGRFLAHLDERKLADKTLVIFTSDNGSYMYRYDDPAKKDHLDDETVQGFRSDHHRANGPFRGTKADIYEAGHRVPFLASWPGTIKPGTKCDKTICLTDIFATCVEITGRDLPEESAPDSFSLLSLLRGGEWTSPRAPVIHHSVGGMFAVRDGQWKLILGNGSGGREAPKGKAFQQPYQLYDMSTDASEEKNVAQSHPDIVTELEAKCLKIRESGRSR